MKFSVIYFLASFLAISGCEQKKPAVQKSATEKTETAKTVPTFAVDSISVNDSLEITKNLTASFTKKILIFPTFNRQNILDSIYAPEKIQLKDYSKENLGKALEEKKQGYFDETKKSLKNFSPDFKQTWTNNSKMAVFSNTNGFLTLVYTGDGYTGGAHGYYYKKFKVFDLKNNKTVQLSDVLTNQDAGIWGRILMDNFLKNDLQKGQSEMLLVKKIPLNDNFYFDAEHLYFLYNQYEIAAYAAGPVLIKVPLSDIKPFLNSDFKKRIGL
ncbi:hypothetical protein OA84_08820 [Kaistella solincola]|uniref:DUF3298 domain-containing protein n=1 Tax=Kaistella solincola TaxID=510955 RepID=A0ABR4ZS58_9FLAO|nr:DUF3298 and DUF4163 domain-containing protein [Kaistella solincola]KIA83589.1 hypothetical protein OA84_08820 [Kaistella solincola]